MIVATIGQFSENSTLRGRNGKCKFLNKEIIVELLLLNNLGKLVEFSILAYY